MRILRIAIVLAMTLPSAALAQGSSSPTGEQGNTSIPRLPGQAPPTTSAGEPVSGSRTMGMNPENRRQDKPGDKGVPKLGKDTKDAQ